MRRFRENVLPSPARWAVLAVLALAFAWPMQVTGYNQNAHYALTKALANGQPHLDDVIGEIGELSTGDTARFEGRLYAVKAPGLAFAVLPGYVVVEAVGMRTTGDPGRALWALHLLGAVLPAIAIVLLALLFGERTQPGYGLAAATILGVATLILPFATLLFAHALSAALGFAAFVVLWRERARPSRAAALALAGLLVGLAIVVEYQLWVLAAILAAYAAARAAPVRRVAAYAAGVAAGVLPLAAFHVWAYRSPFHTPYDDYWRERGVSGRHFSALPSADNAADFLFSSLGLLVLTPVLVCGLAGAVLLYRRGGRAEALVLVGATVAYGVYFSRLGAFGGLGPPRYLVVLVPFAAAGLAIALRAFPLTTLGLAAISAFQMTVMTATGPLAAYDGNWLGRLRARETMETAASLVGVTGWYAILPFFLGVGVAVMAAALGSSRLAVAPREGWLAAGALALWALLALNAPNEHGAPPSEEYVLGAVAGAGTLVAAVFLATRRRPASPSRVQPAGLGR